MGFALIRPAFLTFFSQRSSFALSTTIRSRNEPIAKPLTAWLVLSFSQHNLPPVVSDFRDVICTFKWRSFKINLHVYRQVNSPNSWEKFQICCTDMYLIRFLPDFAVFCMFWRREKSEALTMSCVIYTNWRLKIYIWRPYFSSWSPKGDLRTFLISSPVYVLIF